MTEARVKIFLKKNKLLIIVLLLICFVKPVFSNKENAKKVIFFARQIWDIDTQRYRFEAQINPRFLKKIDKYFRVTFDSNGLPIHSKKILYHRLNTVYFFDKQKRLTHYYFFSGGIKREAVFYNQKRIKTKKIYYSLASGKLEEIDYFRNDGRTIIKQEFYDHSRLRRLIIYYPNSITRSDTDYFSGKKHYYDKEGKKIKTLKFDPKRLEKDGVR